MGVVNEDKLRNKIDKTIDPQPKPAPAPGKGTLVGTQPGLKPGPTGNKYIDHGGTRPADDTTEAIFDDGQRQRLIGSFQQRAMAADTAYKAALMSLRMDKLVEKPDDMSWVLSLLLAGVGLYGASVLSKVVSQLTSASADGLRKYFSRSADAVVGEESGGDRIGRLAKKLHDMFVEHGSTLSTKVQSVSDVQAGQIVAARGWASKTGQKADVNFLDLLADQSSIMFTQIRETGMDGRNDAELLAIHESWGPEHHNVSGYKAQITDQLARFKKSEIPNLGSKMFNSFTDGPLMDAGFSKQGDTIHRSVVQIVFMSGAASRYAIADKYVDQAAPMDKTTNVPQQEVPYPGRVAKYTMEKYSLIKLVDPDLETTAVLRHKAQWNTDPKTIIVNDMSRMPGRPQPQENRPTTPKGYPPPKSNSYDVQDTKDLDWNDPKTWHYQNKEIEGSRPPRNRGM